MSRTLALMVLLGGLVSAAGCGPGSGEVNVLPTTVTQPQVTMSAEPSTSSAAAPDVVGKRLQEAVEFLAAAGYPKVDTVDATGQARPVLEPINWIVQSQEPPAGSPAPPGTAVTLKVSKPTDNVHQAGTVDGVVPNVVCVDLQKAQDMLQAAGFFILWSEDATGQGRQQLVDRNWVVVRQSVAPGERPERLTRITLSAVQFGEPTGDSGCKS
jgi:beta-lactam-binding protein with PASTA domain